MKLRKIINIVLSIESLLLTGYVFALKEETVLLPSFLKEAIKKHLNMKILKLIIENKFISLVIIYFLLLVLLSYLINRILKSESLIKADEKIDGEYITNFENANDTYLPVYLGYFFVSLSIPNWRMFIVIFLILYILSYRSKFSHYNPMFLVFGYKYYFYELNNTKNLLITKEVIKNPKEIKLDKVLRVNDFTFLDVE